MTDQNDDKFLEEIEAELKEIPKWPFKLSLSGEGKNQICYLAGKFLMADKTEIVTMKNSDSLPGFVAQAPARLSACVREIRRLQITEVLNVGRILEQKNEIERLKAELDQCNKQAMAWHKQLCGLKMRNEQLRGVLELIRKTLIEDL